MRYQVKVVHWNLQKYKKSYEKTYISGSVPLVTTRHKRMIYRLHWSTIYQRHRVALERESVIDHKRVHETYEDKSLCKHTLTLQIQEKNMLYCTNTEV